MARSRPFLPAGLSVGEYSSQENQSRFNLNPQSPEVAVCGILRSKRKTYGCHYRSELLTKPMSKRQRIGKAVAKKSNNKNHRFRGVKGPEDKELFSGDDWERICQRGESHGM